MVKKNKSKNKMKSRPEEKIDNKINVKHGINPLGDRVLIMPLNHHDEALTRSGIIIPETVDKEKPHQGKVLAVGPGKWNEDGDALVPMMVKVGQTVVFSKYGPDEIKIGDKEYYVISESSILAILNS